MAAVLGRKLALAVCIAVVALSFTAGSPAKAVIIDLTYSGTIFPHGNGHNLFDHNALFGPDCATIACNGHLGNAPYTAVYRYDTTLGTINTFPNSEFIFGGLLSLNLTVNGITIAVNTENFSLQNTSNIPGPLISVSLAGVSETALNPFGRHNSLRNEIHAPVGAIPASVTTPFTYVVAPGDFHGGQFDYTVSASIGSTFLDFNLAVVTLSIETTETPLPAALPLFASGLGVIGLLARRRRRRVAAIAA